MEKYIVTAAVARFGAGTVLELTAEQASSRRHNLNFVEKDTYQAFNPVEFKHGEEIGLPSDGVKGLEALVAPAESAAGKAAAREQADKAKAAVEQTPAEVAAAATNAAIDAKLKAKKSGRPPKAPKAPKAVDGAVA